SRYPFPIERCPSGVSLRDKNTQSLRETPTSTAPCRPCRPCRLCRLSRQRLSQVLQQSIEHLVRVAAARELALQPVSPARRAPDLLHGDAGGAAVELELEERLGAAAVDDLDPAVAGGALVLDDLDHGVGLAPAAPEVQAVAVAFAPALGSRDGGGAARQPLRQGGCGGGRRDS